MADILVSGLINLETTLRIDRFPLDYFPVTYPFFGVRSTVSGVGYNIARALTSLGDRPSFVSLIGRDAVAALVRQQLAVDGIAGEFVLSEAAQTSQSVILYEKTGRRQIHVDLKDIQERAYPAAGFARALVPCSIAVLCNINFSRPFLRGTRAAGKLVATDVHAVASLDDAYNADFMAAAHILFMSDEKLPIGAEEWARAVQAKYGNEIVVIGLGAEGALLSVKGEASAIRVPAARVRAVVNTIGAGDALFSSFLHFYSKSGDPYGALRRAVVFAGYKVGEAGAAEGFLDEAGVERLHKST
jgi:ribokinase